MSSLLKRVFAAGAILFLLGLMLFSVVITVQAPSQLQDGIVRTTAIVLFVFLAIVVLRYFALLWLGFLEHLEKQVSDDGSAVAEELYLPPITVIIPAYNEGVVIGAAIRSLLRQDYPRFEVLVVDDGSTDDTYLCAKEFEGEHGPAMVRVITKNNGGKAAALNTGIALARHPIVLCMDGDSLLSPDTLRRGVRHFRDPRVGAVAGNVKVSNRVNLWTRLQALEYIEGLNMARRAQGFMRAVNIVPGPIGLFRRKVLVEVGGYETNTYAEDADLTLKVLASGWRIVYEDEAVAYTEAPETLNSLIKQRYRWTRGILQALRKRRRAVFRRGSGTISFSVSMMLFEAILWPLFDVIGSLFFVVIALAYGAGEFIVGWWFLLTVLDIAAAMYTVAMEEEELSLIPLAFAYRFFFILLLNMVKLFATLEEAFNVEMGWGKLNRVGRFAS